MPTKKDLKQQYLSRLPGLERHILPCRSRVLTPCFIATNQSVLPEVRSEPTVAHSSGAKVDLIATLEVQKTQPMTCSVMGLSFMIVPTRDKLFACTM